MSKSSLAKIAGQSGIARKTLEAIPYDRENAITLTRVGQEVMKHGVHHPDLKVLQGCLRSLRKDHLIGLTKDKQNIALFFRHRTAWASNGKGNGHAGAESHGSPREKPKLIDVGEVYRRHGVLLRAHSDPVVVTDELRVTAQPVPTEEDAPATAATPATPATAATPVAPDTFEAAVELVRLNTTGGAVSFNLTAALDQLLNLHMEAAALAEELKRYVQAMPSEQQLAQIRAILGVK